MIRIGVVVQRYGPEVVGGAETLARNISEKLSRKGFDVTVFTTTAADYVTWKNHYPAGETILKGVSIRRFPVARERDIVTFNRLSDAFFAQPPDARDEENWIYEQGPVCPELIAALKADQAEYDLFIFFTYLYHTTIKGIEAVDRPVILFPTAHDEPPLYLRCLRPMMARADYLLFLTRAEMEVVHRTFSPQCPSEVVGTGIEIDPAADKRAFRRKYFIFAPYILYAGRIEKGKGLEAAFANFQALRRMDYLDFILLGKKLMVIPGIDGLKYLGFVPERDKFSAFKGAVLSVQPSPLESLSITTLESFSQGTPVLVNRRCGALVEHVQASGGGLMYEGEEEFVKAFHSIYRNRRLRDRMGVAGREYVRQNFSWDGVMKKIEAAVQRVMTARNGRPQTTG